MTYDLDYTRLQVATLTTEVLTESINEAGQEGFTTDDFGMIVVEMMKEEMQLRLNGESFIKIQVVDIENKIDSIDSVVKFEVGKVYATTNQSFKIQITKRTDKTVWFENIVDGDKNGFCYQGKKRIAIKYGRETVIDGMYQYSAA
jgi:hypothetical protein